MALARQGDHAAFDVLYRRHVTAIYRYCSLRVGGVQADAEDLTSKVFLRAWQSIGRYQEQGRPFLAWLHTIARNLVLDHFRQYHPTVPMDDLLPAPANVPEEVDMRLEREHLREAIAQLTPDQRQVVTYQFILGYNSEETAAMMGKRAGAIRALQMRALQALRKVLGQDRQ